MGYFEDELRKRKEKDDEAFREALHDVAGAVIGTRLRRVLSEKEMITSATGEILKYYQIKTNDKPIPRELESVEEKLDFCFRPHNIMRRNVKLEKNWRRLAIGPMLATTNNGKNVVALIPHRFSGYVCCDFTTGKKIKVTRKIEKTIDESAVCFYRPLPQKKINLSDLLLFMLKQINISDILMFFISVVLLTTLGMFAPWFTSWLFGIVIPNKDITVLISLATFMTTFLITQLLIGCYKTLIESRVSIKVDVAIEAAVMHRIISLPPSFFAGYGAGELANRSQYVKAICSSFIQTIGSTTITSLFSFIYIAQVWAFAPALAVPALLISIVSVIFSIVVILVNMRIIKKRMLLETKESGMSYAMITGIQKIKLAGAEKRMFARWAKLYSESAKLTYNPPFFIKISNVISLAISLLGTLLLYYFAIASKLTVANYYAFTTAYGQVTSAIASFTSIAAAIATIKPTYELAKPILYTLPEANENKQSIVTLRGDVELSHVSFRYRDDEPNIFDNFSLKIKPNEYVAIVGRTGCGKSTLVRLLLGFEKPQRGTISYDHKDINTIDVKSLRAKIGTVMQDAKMFRGDIYSNIVIAAPWTNVEGAWRAAKIAAIDKDIEEMPMGMNTMISEGQGGISGGQRQRLAIARAVAATPNILIFDEATSALDNLTQKQVSDAIDSLKCTRIIIAHRLSTIKNCQRIVVIDGGRIVEEGTYNNLIKKNGFFAELIKRQRLDLSSNQIEK